MKSKSLEFLNGLINEDTTKKQIDIIEYIKKCVNAYKEVVKPKNCAEIFVYFDKLWKMYPKKINKELAKRTFEHKFRGLNEEECKEKANKIYLLFSKQNQQWQDKRTKIEYIPHYSTWLNNQIPNSPHYKGLI